VDINGDVFFTLRTLREWTYGQANNQHETVLFSHIVSTPKEDTSVLTVAVKRANVSIPFVGHVRFQGVNFQLEYSGTWSALVSYDFEISTVLTSQTSQCETELSHVQ